MTPDEQKAIDKLEQKYNQVSFNPDDFMPDRLYHYTSDSGLLGIVKHSVCDRLKKMDTNV
jgi:hypothetical protein